MAEAVQKPIERFDRYAVAQSAGYGWKRMTSKEALAEARGMGAGTHHKYAVWPSHLVAEAATKMAELGLDPSTVELVAEITIRDDDPIVDNARVTKFTAKVGTGDDKRTEPRYQRVITESPKRNHAKMHGVLAHLRHANETRRAIAVRFFFRTRA